MMMIMFLIFSDDDSDDSDDVDSDDVDSDDVDSDDDSDDDDEHDEHDDSDDDIAVIQLLDWKENILIYQVMSQISGQGANGRRASSKGAPKTGKDKGRRRDLFKEGGIIIGFGGKPIKMLFLLCASCLYSWINVETYSFGKVTPVTF